MGVSPHRRLPPHALRLSAPDPGAPRLPTRCPRPWLLRHGQGPVYRMLTEKVPQAILRNAFSGQLVPTEAELALTEGREYESGTALLRRIAQSRPHYDAASPRSRVGRRNTGR